MRRIVCFERIAKAFDFKTAVDEQGNEYVLFADNNLDLIENIQDKTAFEAFENHIHLIDNIKNNEFGKLVAIAQNFGMALLNCLQIRYPQKRFIVYVSLRLKDSMIIRFHQRWENEEPFCNPRDFVSKDEKVFIFQN